MSAGVLQHAAFRRDIETEALYPGTEPSDPGVGHRIPLLSENITQTPQYQDQGVLFNQVSTEAAVAAGFEAGGTIECDLRYGDLDRLYALGLGFENPNTDATGGSPHQIAAGEERHVYECHENLRSLEWASGDRNSSVGSAGDEGHWLSSHRRQCRGGIYFSKGVTDVRMWPAMVESMEFNMTPRSSRVSFGLVGRRVERGSYNSANWTSYNGLDYNSDAGVSPVLMHQLTAKWGAAGASSFQNSAMGVSELNLRVVNNLKADDWDASSGLYHLEPWRNGQRTVTGSFLFTRYQDDALAVFEENDLPILLQFNWSGPTLGANNATLALGIPHAHITRLSQPIAGPGIIQQRCEFKAAARVAALGSIWQGTGDPFEHVTLTQDANGKPGELLIATTNEYDQNVFEND
ncbi:MAG: hypothetical protein ACPGWS_05435 [Solirubrobacterales bacterium]